MLKKRILSSILALCIILSGMAFGASATDSWDGSSINTAWNTGEAEMYISTAEELAGLASLVNSGNDFAGKTIYLSNDIDLNQEAWTPIGSITTKIAAGTAQTSISGNAYAGTFDGQGHKIIGLAVSHTAGGNMGFALFGLSTGTIKNLGVDSTSVIDITNATDCASYAAILGFNSGGLVSGCWSEATITDNATTANTGAAIVGGIVGCNDFGGIIEYCYNIGTIDTPITKARVGGIAGSSAFSNAGAKIRYCYNKADITVVISDNVGGIVGFTRFGTIDYSYNTGNITSNHTASTNSVGGIVGVKNNNTLTNCYNIGTVTSARAGNGNCNGIIGSGSTPGANSYYLTGSADVSKPDFERTAEEIKALYPTFAASPEGVSFEADAYNINSGFPVFNWQNDSYSYSASDIIAMITALPIADEITLEDEEEIIAARLAFETLTEDEKSNVTNIAVLEAAEAKINELKADATVAPIIAKIAALPDTDELTLSDKPDVIDAKAAYDALSEEMKAYVTNADKLSSAIAKIEELSASVGTSTWDGASTDTAWNTGEDKMFISTAAELAGFATLVNGGTDFAGKSIYLLSNIDLASYTWTSIGRVTASVGNGTAANAIQGSAFSGSFDGLDNKIIALSLTTNSTDKAYGLFGYSKGIIKNISIDATSTIDASNTEQNSDYGTIVGINVGGKVINCSSNATISDSSKINDSNTANIGGIVGRNDYAGIIEYCYNNGTINLLNIKSRTGGIAGASSFFNNDTGVIMRYCYNAGDISVALNDCVGGLIGFNRNGLVDFCYNSGDVSSTSDTTTDSIAGLIAVLRSSNKLTNSYNIGTISSVNAENNNCKGVIGSGTNPSTTANVYTLAGVANKTSDYDCDADTIKSTYPAISATIHGVTFVDDVNDINYGFPVFNWQEAVAEPELADYTSVEVAEANVPSDLSIYTDETVAVLDAAIEAVQYNLPADRQEDVEAFATAINDAVAALKRKLPNELKLSIGISSRTDTVSDTKHDIIWNAKVSAGGSDAQDAYDLFNDSDVKIKEYGVYYGVGADYVSRWTELGTDPTLSSFLKKNVFDEGDDIAMFTSYGFRLRNCPISATRAAMFYVVYELDGIEYNATSEIDIPVA